MEESQRSSRRKRGGRSHKLKKNQEIENAVVRETFLFDRPSGEQGVGEGGYITAEINTKRYYGVLIDQESLSAASLLHLQDEASGLDLNKRMEALLCEKKSSKRLVNERKPKRQKIDETEDSSSTDFREIQKFRYVPNASPSVHGYRVLLATYNGIDAASEGVKEQHNLIQTACDGGGGFAGDYYYQYQLPNTTLKAPTAPANANGLRLSLPLNRFLSLTSLPEWYPMSANSGMKHQSKALELLHLRHNRGQLEPISTSDTKHGGLTPISTALKPMETRSVFRVCVVGGGIAGLSTCVDIFRLCDREGIEVEIVLLEGRNRLGGRIHTAALAPTTQDEDSVDIELGATWIHGTENNPIMSLACDAGASFVNANEDVKMLHSGLVPVDPNVDDKSGELFDQLLDAAANAAWECTEGTANATNVIRWHAANLHAKEKRLPIASPTPDHRISHDTSVDEAMGASILRDGFSSFACLSKEEKYMLQWYTKNVEYVLGADIADLSMKYWDTDDRNAFEGTDVLLKEGYSKIIDHMYCRLTGRGKNFSCLRDCSATKIEYHRRSTTSKHQHQCPRGKGMLALSDSCCVSTANENMQIKCDFVVCTVPLGVLKASISTQEEGNPPIVFAPELPDIKKDAISSVGFGLLNKIFLRFERAFWRPTVLSDQGPTQFGNATSTFPQHYMFVDVGASWARGSDFPPILMSLVSGREAAACELLSDDEIVEQVLVTLRDLCGKEHVPNPVSFAITRWGADEFSRGCFTFLPPGATDQDLETLQTPINGNGDSLLLESSEIMRLFFAGEHTTALHPSVTHGALLSGSRAASEVVDTMFIRTHKRSDCDREVPIAHYRKLNPTIALRCAFCGDDGSTRRQGKLLSFKRGSRYALCHNNCAEFSPEVEVADGHWKNVVNAVSRSKAIICHICSRTGASIGCSKVDCNLSVHYKCGEDTGWRFDKDGKAFFCAKHRHEEFESSRRISVQHFVSQMGSDLRCVLCGQDEGANTGSMRAYIVPGSVAGSNGSSMVAMHSFCAKYSNVVVLDDDPSSPQDCDYANVGAIMEAIKVCTHCGYGGATISCSNDQCSLCYHFICAQTQGCNLKEGHERFFCTNHGVETESSTAGSSLDKTKLQRAGFSCIKDSIFEQIDGFKSERRIPLGVSASFTYSQIVDVMIKRVSFADAWPIQLHALKDCESEQRYLCAAEKGQGDPTLKTGDVLISVNACQLGTGRLKSMDSLISFLNAHTHIKIQLGRRNEQLASV